jgi:UDP-GlcNAc:undecaprenyl-phosphate/decaprenyl-phosphate GlcNAc-1-phosphate transferase
MFYIVTAIIAFLADLLITPIIIAFAHRKNFFDSNGGRKIHTGDVPRIGGIGIAWSFAIAIAFAILLLAPPLRNRLATSWQSAVLIIGGFMAVHIVGLIDDFRAIRARYKLFFQIIVAIGIIAAGYRFKSIDLPFAPHKVDFGLFSYVITFFWIIGMMNAVNLIDGMDGLATGISIIVFGTYAFAGFANNDVTAGAVSAALMGSCIGFLFYNYPKASIFMGDSGSLFLGTAFALLPLILEEPGGRIHGILPAVVLSAIPIFDTLWAIARRLKRGRSILSPDREHLHHKLLSLGLGDRGVLAVVYGICILLAASVISLQYIGSGIGFSLMVGTLVFTLIVLIGIRVYCHARIGKWEPPHS